MTIHASPIRNIASISGATQPRPDFIFRLVGFAAGGGVSSPFLRIRDFGTRNSPVDVLLPHPPGRAGGPLSARSGTGREPGYGHHGNGFPFRASVSVVLPWRRKE